MRLTPSHGTTSLEPRKKNQQKFVSVGKRNTLGPLLLVISSWLHEPAPNPFPETDATTTEVDAEQPIREKEKRPSADGAVHVDAASEPVSSPNPDPDIQLARSTSRLSTRARSPMSRRRSSLSPSVTANVSSTPPVHVPTRSPSTHTFDIQSVTQRSETVRATTPRQIVVRVIRPLRALLSPSTCALVVSLPIALIRPLKALFVDISASGGPDFKAPNGFPPLEFVIDTGMSVAPPPFFHIPPMIQADSPASPANFMGGIAVPLILLGTSFARIKIPRPLSRLPIMMAIFTTTMVKLVILPVIGVLLVQAMTKVGLVNKDERALRFVMMFLAGTPTAIT